MQQLASQIAKEAMKGPLKHDRTLRELTSGVVEEEEGVSTDDPAEDDEELEGLEAEQMTGYTSGEDSEEEGNANHENPRDE